MKHIKRIGINNKRLSKSEWKSISNNYGVYKIWNRHNNKFYIGSANNLLKRYYSHIRLLQVGNHPNLHLQNSWNKYGHSQFEFHILNITSSHLGAIKIEQKYLNKFVGSNECYNISTDATSPMKGRHHTDATKEKLRLCDNAKQGGIFLKNWVNKNWKGKKWSKRWIDKFKEIANTRDDTKRIKSLKTVEHREKISKIMKGKKNPSVSKRLKKLWKNKEYRQKMFELLSVPQSDEQKKKSSVTNLGKSISLINSNGKIINLISIRNFSETFKIRRREIQEVINGKRLEYRGWRLYQVNT
jgi:group I intron endonuclease